VSTHSSKHNPPSGCTAATPHPLIWGAGEPAAHYRRCANGVCSRRERAAAPKILLAADEGKGAVGCGVKGGLSSAIFTAVQKKVEDREEENDGAAGQQVPTPRGGESTIQRGKGEGERFRRWSAKGLPLLIKEDGQQNIGLGERKVRS